MSYILKRNLTLDRKLREVNWSGDEVFISCISYFEVKRGLLAINAIRQIADFDSFFRKYDVRVKPNGGILCSVISTSNISVYGYKNGWYKTNVCGHSGYIHQSQIRLQTVGQNSEAEVCNVVGIKTGQLALRFTPNGKSRAGLNNGNAVLPIQRQGNWSYVRVLSGPNNKINGLEGWVNSNYLSCP